MRGPTLILNVALSFTLNFFFFFINTAQYTQSVSVKIRLVFFGVKRSFTLAMTSRS